MSLSSFDLTGRLALVTGSIKGIGFGLADGLAAAGARVVLNARNAEQLVKAAVDLGARHEGRVWARAFDVTDPAAVRDAVDGIERDIGAIDILINNAGMTFRTPLQDYPEETWAKLMHTNLDSVFYVSKAVVQHMIPRGRGKIINICSVMSEIGRAAIAPYTASKGAVKMLTKGMCIDWAPHGIQVNGIGPGYFKTELTEALVKDEAFSSWLIGRTPARRWGDIEDLQGAAVFLASDAARFVNGHILYVDGGVLATL
jgi:gluconate 5-dehydrogenase